MTFQLRGHGSRQTSLGDPQAFGHFVPFFSRHGFTHKELFSSIKFLLRTVQNCF